MLTICYLNRFRRDIKRMQKRGTDVTLLKELLECLVHKVTPPLKFRCHKLVGNWADRYECHLAPDWLIIYSVTDTELILERTGTHSDLFG